MLTLPKHGSKRRFGITWRWRIMPPSISDYSVLAAGSLLERLRVIRRVRRASRLAILLCAREIDRDFRAMFREQGFPKSESPGEPSASDRQFVDQYAAELTRATGMSPRRQAAELTPREWMRLLAHCVWQQSREDRFYASMTAREVIPDYPRLPDGDGKPAAAMDEARAKAILAAWSGRTVH